MLYSEKVMDRGKSYKLIDQIKHTHHNEKHRRSFIRILMIDSSHVYLPPNLLM